jgi:hypothetical protein
MFAAPNTVEPPILDRGFAMLMEREKTWYRATAAGVFGLGSVPMRLRPDLA